MNEFKKIILQYPDIFRTFNGKLLKEIGEFNNSELFIEKNKKCDLSIKSYNALYEHEDGDFVSYLKIIFLDRAPFFKIKKFSKENAPGDLPDEFYKILGIENLEPI